MEEDEDLFEKLFDSPAVDEDERDRMTLQQLKEEDEKKKVRVVEKPREPTADEVQEHELHHANFEPWCKVCLEGQGKERAHRRQQEDPRKHIIYSDYMYFTKDGKQKPKEEVEKSKDADDLKGLAIVLTAIDKDSQCQLEHCSSCPLSRERFPGILDPKPVVLKVLAITNDAIHPSGLCDATWLQISHNDRAVIHIGRSELALPGDDVHTNEEIALSFPVVCSGLTGLQRRG